MNRIFHYIKITVILLITNPLFAQLDSFPKMEFLNPIQDLDTIYELPNNKLITWYFKNTSNVPLVIRNVKSSCGCLVPSYTKGPIMPNEYGTVQGRFYSKGRRGRQHKSMTVQANTKEGVHILRFKTYIKEGEAPKEKTSFKFEKEEINFDTLNWDERKYERFRLINTEASPLNIAIKRRPLFSSRLIYSSQKPPLRMSINPIDTAMLLMGNQGRWLVGRGDTAYVHIWAYNSIGHRGAIKEPFILYINETDTIHLNINAIFRDTASSRVLTYPDSKVIFENGQLKSKYQYNRNSGQLNQETQIEGWQMTQTTYDKNGLKISTRIYNDKLDKWQTHIKYRNGVKYIMEERFDNKEVVTSWYPSGQVWIVTNRDKTGYHMQGLHERYYENGQLEKRMIYEKSQLNGLYEEWFENGQKRMEGNYDCRKKVRTKNIEGIKVLGSAKVGVWKYWNKKGQLIKEKKY